MDYGIETTKQNCTDVIPWIIAVGNVDFPTMYQALHVYIENLDHLRDIMVFHLHLEEKTSLSDAHLDTLFVWQKVYDASAVGICHALQQDYCFWKHAAAYSLSGHIHINHLQCSCVERSN